MLVDTESATETPIPAAEPAAAGETAAPVAAAEPTKAPPPAPEKPAEPTSALDAALKALDKGKTEAAATAAESAGATTETKSDAAADDAQDDLGDVPMLPAEVFRTLPKEARTAVNQLRKQVVTLRPDANRGKAVADYLRASGMSPQEFAELQDVGALLRTDPAKAREKLVAKLDEIDTALGLKLPDDLKGEVDGGYISEERAKELAQTRAKARGLEQHVTEAAVAEAKQAQAGAVVAWAERTAGSDPDFGRKQPSIEREIRLALADAAAAGKPPRTAEEATAIAQAAYERVNEMLKPFRQASAPVPKSPSSAASSAPASAPAPTTAVEAAWAALRKGR